MKTSNETIKQFINENMSFDKINPSYYKGRNGLEAIEVSDEFTKDLVGPVASGMFNAIKYIIRWRFKNGVVDLKKARWYIRHVIYAEEKRLSNCVSEKPLERDTSVFNISMEDIVTAFCSRIEDEYERQMTASILSQCCLWKNTHDLFNTMIAIDTLIGYEVEAITDEIEEQFLETNQCCENNIKNN